MKRLKSDWTKAVLARFYDFLESISNNDKSREPLRTVACYILCCAEEKGFQSPAEITPQWLSTLNPLWKSVHTEAWGRGSFGRFLVAEGIWSATTEGEFKRKLKAWETLHGSAKEKPGEQPSAKPLKKQSTSERLRAAGELIYQLASRAGLTTRKLQQLEVGMIRDSGIELRDGRKILFGDGQHEVSKEKLDIYRRLAQPRKFLFFRGGSAHGSLDFARPAVRQTLMAALRRVRPKTTIEALRMEHFRGDFNRARSQCELRSHLRNVHGLSNGYAAELICGRRLSKRSPEFKGFANEAKIFPIPAPYLLAAIGASCCIPTRSRLLKSGKLRSCTLVGLLERYDITIRWPVSLFDELNRNGQVADRALRLLYRLAWEHWVGGRKVMSRHIGRAGVWRQDRDLLDRFAQTEVGIIDKGEPREWSGSLFEFHSQKCGFWVPLVEVMTGGAWRSKCMACWHPRRMEVDQDILKTISVASENGGLVKGLTAIAERYGEGLSYQSLRRHAGLNPPVPGRGNTQRSHIARASAAPLVWSSCNLMARLSSLSRLPLILYGLLLATGSEQQEISPVWIRRQLGLPTTAHAMSVALNELSDRKPALIHHHERTSENCFLVRLSVPTGSARSSN